MNCVRTECEGEVSSRGLCKRHYDQASTWVRSGKTSWYQLEMNGQSMPLKNLPAFTHLDKLGYDDELVYDLVYMRSKEVAQKVLEYAAKYGARDTSIEENADGSCLVGLHMLPNELMRIYGYVDGLEQE